MVNNGIWDKVLVLLGTHWEPYWELGEHNGNKLHDPLGIWWEHHITIWNTLGTPQVQKTNPPPYTPLKGSFVRWDFYSQLGWSPFLALPKKRGMNCGDIPSQRRDVYMYTNSKPTKAINNLHPKFWKMVHTRSFQMLVCKNLFSLHLSLHSQEQMVKSMKHKISYITSQFPNRILTYMGSLYKLLPCAHLLKLAH